MSNTNTGEAPVAPTPEAQHPAGANPAITTHFVYGNDDHTLTHVSLGSTLAEYFATGVSQLPTLPELHLPQMPDLPGILFRAGPSIDDWLGFRNHVVHGQSYAVEVTREGDSWIGDVVDVPGAHSYAKNLTALTAALEEAVALVLDLPDDASAPTFKFEYRGVDDAFTEAGKIGEIRSQIEELQQQLAVATLEAAQKLAAAGYSVRDIAGVLQMSPGRVSQVIPKSGRAQVVEAEHQGGGTVTSKTAKSAAASALSKSGGATMRSAKTGRVLGATRRLRKKA